MVSDEFWFITFYIVYMLAYLYFSMDGLIWVGLNSALLDTHLPREVTRLMSARQKDGDMRASTKERNQKSAQVTCARRQTS